MNTTMGAPQRRFPWVWMGHREYDPLACRFLTRDPIGYDGGINLYAYCGNNPIMFADPSGFGHPNGKYKVVLVLGNQKGIPLSLLIYAMHLPYHHTIFGWEAGRDAEERVGDK